MKKTRIGLIGLGTVGSGLVEYLKENGAEVDRKAGCEIILHRVFDRNPYKLAMVPEEARAGSIDEVIDDPEVDIFVELVGGKKAAEYMLQALRKGKHVVTANKAALAEQGPEIFREAAAAGRSVGFEASVCGGVPVIRMLRENLDRIDGIKGILNGTTNYILSKMDHENLDYEVALKKAQELGFAESDPAFDVEGLDAAQKLSILAFLAFGVMIDYRKIFTEGITSLTRKDIEYARDFGYSIKLIAEASMNEHLKLFVRPVLVPMSHPLASVRNEFNAVYITGKWFGPQLFLGKGAGKKPTADAVIRDIVEIAKGMPAVPTFAAEGSVKVAEPGSLESMFYLCFSAVNKPGVLAVIAGILGKNGINIRSAVQKGSDESGSLVDVVITTSKASQGAVERALEEIDGLDVVGRKTRCIRMEG